MATNRTAAIGMLASGISAPRSTANPPNISTRIVSHPMRCGAGTPSACKIAGNASGPLASLAKPCSMKPYAKISRNGIGAQRAIGDLLIRSIGWSRQFGDHRFRWLAERISMISFLGLSRGLEKLANGGRDLCVVRFQRERAGVEEADIRARNIALERRGSR